MTSAQHLWEAKAALDTPADLDLSLRHLGAIPANSAETAKAQVLEKEVRQKESERNPAQAESARAAKQASEARAASVRQFETALRNVGYDLSAEASGDDQAEVVITSKEFDDTDRRIRFLSFLRNVWGPAGAVCYQGFSKVRLRSSRIPPSASAKATRSASEGYSPPSSFSSDVSQNTAQGTVTDPTACQPELPELLLRAAR